MVIVTISISSAGGVGLKFFHWEFGCDIKRMLVRT